MRLGIWAPLRAAGQVGDLCFSERPRGVCVCGGVLPLTSFESVWGSEEQ